MAYILSGFADEAGKMLDDQLRVSAANSIRFIEMRGVDGSPLVDRTPDEAREIKKKLDDAGFKLSAVGSPFGKINIKDDFAPHLEQFKRGVEIAHILEAKYIRMFSFFITEGENADDYKDEVMARLSQFVANADGVTLAHENEKEIFGDTAERCKQIYDEFGGQIKLVFDPANFVQCGVDTAAAYKLLAPYVEYMHIKDARMADGFVVPAGEGDGNVEMILNEFANAPGERFLTLEPHLKVFDGFAGLEGGAEMQEAFSYPSGEAAFTAAATALKSLLCANGFKQSKDLERGFGIWTR